MNTRPTVSIVISNYNYGSFLRAAIDSALSQTYPHVEVIVVDDGSTDNSREIIASYTDRITTVLKQNGGLGSALNAGLRASKGDVILFLDSDDTLLPPAVESVIGEWREGVVHIFFPLAAIDANGRRLGGLVGGKTLPDRILGPFGAGSPTSGNAFSRAALDKVSPIPEDDCGIAADNYLTATTSLLGKVRRLADPLGEYRTHGNSLTSIDYGLTQVRRFIKRDLRIYETMSRLAPETVGSPEEWLGRHPQHWVGRITSVRASPNDHPYPDTLPGLTRRAIKATWRHPYWNFRRKAAYTAFVLCYVLSPTRALSALKKLEGRACRPGLKHLLGFNCGSSDRIRESPRRAI